MKVLYRESSLPLFADESCVSEADVNKCHGYFHGVNIKLTKCSGITPARRMISNAKELELRVMIGCMNESSVGTAAIAQLAPLVDYIDMDGPLLLAEDTAKGVSFNYGKIISSNKPGLGISLDPF
jgi:L-alanine-DL-glutamate epimerase-like enolase superfamily enzyme